MLDCFQVDSLLLQLCTVHTSSHLVLCLLEPGGDHDLLEHGPVQGPQFPVRHGLHGGCPLAVVEDGQLPEGLAHAQAPQHLPLLDNLELALPRDIEVGPAVACNTTGLCHDNDSRVGIPEKIKSRYSGISIFRLN